AESLPPAQVIRVPGIHRWKTWRALWQDFLVRGVFDRPDGREDEAGPTEARPGENMGLRWCILQAFHATGPS
ncbi:MAG TPA: hypothetical protein VFB95_04635, partial [Candidatus Cryosericum sp.]|nr:hypothetical protein [Candidatus Cryosericum sp.]